MGRIEEGDAAQEVIFADGEIAKGANNGGSSSGRCSVLIVEEKEDGEVNRVIVPVDKKGDDQGEGGGIALILRRE